jgi:hypothetical protein
MFKGWCGMHPHCWCRPLATQRPEVGMLSLYAPRMLTSSEVWHRPEAEVPNHT